MYIVFVHKKNTQEHIMYYSTICFFNQLLCIFHIYIYIYIHIYVCTRTQYETKFSATRSPTLLIYFYRPSFIYLPLNGLHTSLRTYFYYVINTILPPFFSVLDPPAQVWQYRLRHQHGTSRVQVHPVLLPQHTRSNS